MGTDHGHLSLIARWLDALNAAEWEGTQEQLASELTALAGPAEKALAKDQATRLLTAEAEPLLREKGWAVTAAGAQPARRVTVRRTMLRTAHRPTPGGWIQS